MAGPGGGGGTCLDDADGAAPPVDKAVLLEAMLGGLSARRPLLDDEAGRRALADEVRRRCATLGQRVRVTLPAGELTGVAAAIDDAGRLVVETASGPRAVSAGDVVHLRPESRPAFSGRRVHRRGHLGRANMSGTMRLLVTGGAGFIGSNFARYWVERHPEDHVVVYDVLTYAGNRPSLSDIEDQIVFVQGDICDADAAEKALRGEEIDTIVHFAAESHNSLAVLNPGLFFRTNVLGTQTMLEAARQVGVDRFHHVSTCEVYGDLPLDTEEAFTEDSPYRPRTPYNASKAGADHAVRAYAETYELPITITNCANNYGAYQFPEKLIPHFCALALDDKPLTLYASTENRREWLHVVDHCTAIDAVLARGKVGETYHVGSGVEASIMEVADRILAALGKPESLKTIVPDRPGHDRRYILDSSKLRRELGWAPSVEWDQGLADTVAWYAAHREWWEPLIARAPVAEGAWGGAGAG